MQVSCCQSKLQHVTNVMGQIRKPFATEPYFLFDKPKVKLTGQSKNENSIQILSKNMRHLISALVSVTALTKQKHTDFGIQLRFLVFVQRYFTWNHSMEAEQCLSILIRIFMCQIVICSLFREFWGNVCRWRPRSVRRAYSIGPRPLAAQSGLLWCHCSWEVKWRMYWMAIIRVWIRDNL